MSKGSLSDHGVGIGKYRKNSIIDLVNLDTTVKLGNKKTVATFGSTVNVVRSVLDATQTSTSNYECVVGCVDGTVSRINVSTGAVLWTQNLGSTVYAIDTAYISSTTIFAVLAGNKAYLLNPTTGAILNTGIVLPDTGFRYINVFSDLKVVCYNPSTMDIRIYASNLQSFTASGNARTIAVGRGQSQSSTTVFDRYCFNIANRASFLVMGALWVTETSQYYHSGIAFPNNLTPYSSYPNMGTSSPFNLYNYYNTPTAVLTSYKQTFEYTSYSDYSTTANNYVYTNTQYYSRYCYGYGLMTYDGAKLMQHYVGANDPQTLPNGYQRIDTSCNTVANTPAFDMINSSASPIIAWGNGSTLYYNNYYGYKITG